MSACAILVGLLAGCSGIERADVSFVAGDGPAAVRLLRSGVRTEKAELSLVEAALRVIAASGGPRPSVDGRAHFLGRRAAFYGLTLVRRNGGSGGAVETWRIDDAWALVELRGNRTGELPEGIVLCWEGDLRLAVETLGVVLPPPALDGTSPRRAPIVSRASRSRHDRLRFAGPHGRRGLAALRPARRHER